MRMMTIFKTCHIAPLLLIGGFFVLGCNSSPSEEEIKSLISIPICIEPIQFEEITVGSKQAVEDRDFRRTYASDEWYPVRVTYTAKCIPGNRVYDFRRGYYYRAGQRILINDRLAEIERIGVMRSVTEDYRFIRNEYNEWDVYEGRRR